MRLFPSLLAAAAIACATSEPPEDKSCTDPKLAMLSQDVADAIDLTLLNMQVLTHAKHTRPQFGNYKAVTPNGTFDFKNRSMLVNDGNGMVSGNATLCEQVGIGEINCFVGSAKDFKQDPVLLTNLRTVSLKGTTVAVTAIKVNATKSETQWISADMNNRACGAFSRYGESSRWCVDPWTGKQPLADQVRAEECIEDFEVSSKRINDQLEAYKKGLTN